VNSRGSGLPKRLLFSVLRIAIALALALVLLWWLGLRMAGTNMAKAAPLSEAEIGLRSELAADVQELAGNIGERNMHRYPQLLVAADFIESSFSRAGLHPRRDSYEMNGKVCHNIEAEIRGTQGAASQPPDSQIILIGAHYDSVFGSPGANDNGSGVAALLALSRRFATRSTTHTLRFVAFVNEEPPYFQTPEMGSFVYAGRCKAHGDRIKAMISLETIGYFSDAPNSQKYPAAGLGVFYPKVGNFIGFVGNVGSRVLLRRAVDIFRKQKKLPSVFLATQLSRDHDYGHGAVPVSALSRCHRHARQTRLRSLRSGRERSGKND
jgi:hypothetical protein